MKKRNNKKSIVKTLLAQSTFFVITIFVVSFSMMVFATALHLFFISNDIHSIEESGRWTEEAHERYDELIAERIAVKEESVIGYAMVSMGSNILTQILRIIILVGLLAVDAFTLEICGDIIKYHFRNLANKRSFRY